MQELHRAHVVLEWIVINADGNAEYDYKHKTKRYYTFGPETYFVIETFLFFRFRLSKRSLHYSFANF